MRDQAARLFLVPQAIADAGLDAAGAASPLFRRRPADLDRRQPGQAAGRLKPGHARQPAVDHNPHALDGQAGFRHRGRQHHLAASGGRRLDGPVLLALVQRAIESDDIDGWIAQPLVQPLRGAVDFALPRQEGQHRPRLFPQRQHHRPRHGILESLGDVTAQVTGLDREHPTLGLDYRRPVQQPGHPDDVERRRHDQHAQVLAQHRLTLARQRQAQVGVQAAFMELVEQDRADALQRRVVQNHPGEDPFRDHFDSGPGADPALKPRAIADRLARLLPQTGGHSVRRRPCGQPPRLQNQNLAAAQPWLVQQGQRHDGRLTSARRRSQDDRIGCGQRSLQRLQNDMNRQHHPGCSPKR
ncbi:hypothetical protein D3C80_1080380 [compost metagenome]